MVRGQRPRRVRVTKVERELGSQQPVQEAHVHSLAVQARSYLVEGREEVVEREEVV